MKAVDIMTKPVFATTLRASVRDVATQLVVNGLSGMPVAERDGAVVGIITEADIIGALGEGKRIETLAAEDIMTREPIVVGIETPLEEIIRYLRENHILRVPVIDHGKLVGIISRSDIIKAVLEPEFMTFP
jgi:CBS domain-containing protein